MRAATILGPVTGRQYRAYDIGGTWNGLRVFGFTGDVLAAIIAAGDGTDANGEGLGVVDGVVVDVTDGHDEPVEKVQIAAETLYVPAGRNWEEVGPGGIGYDADNRCQGCAEHIADPHSPQCPAVLVSVLREDAAAHDEGEIWVSRQFLAVAGRVAAALVEMDHAAVVRLAAWPEVAEFIDMLTGDQWNA